MAEETKVDLYELKKKIYVGGDLSMRFGNLTYIYAAPLVGFEFYKNLSVGLTGIYQYVRINNFGSIVTEGTFGGGAFIRYRPIEFLLFQTEFDILNSVNYTSAPGKRINFPAFMLGGGYAGSLGNRAYYNVMLMYDFIDNPNMTVWPVVTFAPIYLRYGFVWYLA
ncbi:MAG: hypothetical protein IPG07_16170 [Crocinitomicaceae bacterium]|nr:hypothetical protein [Crocinitomicaceae bacterium]